MSESAERKMTASRFRYEFCTQLWKYVDPSLVQRARRIPSL